MARKKNAKEPNPINVAFWAPIVALLGFIAGFIISYITFVYYGGN